MKKKPKVVDYNFFKDALKKACISGKPAHVIFKIEGEYL